MFTIATNITVTPNFDPAHEAEKILCEHSEGVMSCTTMEFDSNEEMLEATIRECSFILTNKLVEGKFTPMQFNAVRNELGKLLWKVFGPYVEAEANAELKKFVESLR